MQTGLFTFLHLNHFLFSHTFIRGQQAVATTGTCFSDDTLSPFANADIAPNRRIHKLFFLRENIEKLE